MALRFVGQDVVRLRRVTVKKLPSHVLSDACLVKSLLQSCAVVCGIPFSVVDFRASGPHWLLAGDLMWLLTPLGHP